MRRRRSARSAARGSATSTTSKASGTSGTSGFLGDLLEVFQPSRRHVVEEQERRRDHAQLPESGAPPVVDLERGIVHLPPPVAGPGSPGGTRGGPVAPDVPVTRPDRPPP